MESVKEMKFGTKVA